MTDLRKRLQCIVDLDGANSAPLASTLVAILDACDEGEAEGYVTLNIAWLEAVIERAVGQ